MTRSRSDDRAPGPRFGQGGILIAVLAGFAVVGLTVVLHYGIRGPRPDLRERALAAIQSGRPDRALADLEAGAGSLPAAEEAGLRALALVRCGRAAEAEAELGRTLGVRTPAASLARAELELGRGRPAEALRTLGESPEAEAYRGDASLLRAYACLEAGRCEEVAGHLRNAMPYLDHVPEPVRENARRTLELLSGLPPEHRMRVAPGSTATVLPFVERGAHLFVECTLGASATEAMVDSGHLFPATVTAELAARLDLRPLGTLQTVGVAGRPLEVGVVLIERLRVGGFELLNVPATTLPADVRAYGIDEYVTLGRGFLRAAGTMTVDFPARQLALAQPEPVAVEPASRITIPFLYADVLVGPVVPVELRGRAFGFILDTGSPWTVVDQELFDELIAPDLAPDAARSAVARGTKGAVLGRSRFVLDTIRIADAEFVDVEAAAIDLGGVLRVLGRYHPGIVGVDLFRGSCMHFDFGRCTLTVVRPRPPAEDE